MSTDLRPLKVGLLLDDWKVHGWIASIVSQICASDTADIAAILCHSSNGSKRAHFLPHSHARSGLSRLGRLYFSLDHRIFNPVPNALEQVNLKSRLDKCPLVRIEPIFEGPHFRFSETDTAHVRSLGLDVLLLFCTGLPAEQTLRLARYGIWSFLDHESLVTDRVPIGFWEVLEQRPVMKQILYASLPGSQRPLILHHYSGPTDLRSIKRARNNYLWKSSSFVNRKLEALHKTQSLEAIADSQQDSDIGPPQRAASNFGVMKSILSHVSRFIQDLITYGFYDNQWVMAYKFGAADSFIDSDSTGYRWLVPPKDRFWADPFPVRQGDQYFLFFEEYLYSSNKGHICVAPIDQDGFSEMPKIILKCDHHLSYPFIFSWNGDWYLIPESEEADRIDVYKFESFPYQVKFHKTIMDNIRAVDTTLCEIDRQWWMFTGIAPCGTHNVDEVFLFHADQPFGPWVAHPQNPIKSDVRSARPAGKVHGWRGKFYRPAQDCSQGYGYGIRFQEIKTLTTDRYLEEEAETLLPTWSPDIEAVHTFNRAGNLTVVDAKKWRSR